MLRLEQVQYLLRHVHSVFELSIFSLTSGRLEESELHEVVERSLNRDLSASEPPSACRAHPDLADMHTRSSAFAFTFLV